MKKVLIVSYNFPPVGGAGVQRPVKFVKYLRNYGWEPLVLSVANPSVPVFDNGLLKDIPAGVAVYGARSFEPSYAQKREFASGCTTLASRLKGAAKRVALNFLLPDLQVLWWPGLVLNLMRIIRRDRPSVLFVSAPPFSSFLPVIFLGRLMGLPVVLDYRDEWAFSRNQWENAVNTPLAKRLDSLLERYAVRRCSAFTAANASYVTSIYALFPEIAKDKGTVVTNGFDLDDFAAETAAVPPDPGGRITIVYTGTVWKATSLKDFVTALKTILEKDPSLRELLRVKIFGRVVDSEKGYLQDGDLDDVVELYGYVEHAELMAETMAGDVLLLTLSELPGAEKIITGKAFEYMASGKQILAIVPEGETRDLLTLNYNKLSLARANDIDGICLALSGILAGIRTIRETPGSDVSHFSRQALTSRLAAVLEKVAAR
jgi:glycosyltransferase involved in cell wall biosynthesis